jgi:hypothetical protein
LSGTLVGTDETPVLRAKRRLNGFLLDETCRAGWRSSLRCR